MLHHLLTAGVLAKAGKPTPTCVQSHVLLQQCSRKEVEWEMHADAPAGPQPAGSYVCSAAQLLHESCGRQQQWESAQGLEVLESAQGLEMLGLLTRSGECKPLQLAHLLW